LAPLEDIHGNDLAIRSHCRQDSGQGSEASTMLPSSPPPCNTDMLPFSSDGEDTQPSASRSRGDSRMGPKEAPTPLQSPVSAPPASYTRDDIGSLLLQAFQIRDDYLKLQERFSDMEKAASEEISSLQERCSAMENAASEEISGLQQELSAAHEEIGVLHIELAATRAATGGCSHTQAAPKDFLLAEIALEVASRGAAHQLRSACFEAWHGHASSAKAHRSQRLLSSVTCAPDSELGTEAVEDVLILTTEGSASKIRAPPRDRYLGVGTPESLSKNASRTTTAQSTPFCSPLCSRATTPGRLMRTPDSSPVPMPGRPMRSPASSPARTPCRPMRTPASSPARVSVTPECLQHDSAMLMPQPPPLPTLFSVFSTEVAQKRAFLPGSEGPSRRQVCQ